MKKTLTILLVLTMAIMGVWAANPSPAELTASIELNSSDITEVFKIGIAEGTDTLFSQFNYDVNTEEASVKDQYSITTATFPAFSNGTSNLSFYIWYQRLVGTFGTDVDVTLGIAAPIASGDKDLDYLNATAVINSVASVGATKPIISANAASNFFKSTDSGQDRLTFSDIQMKSAGWAKYTISLDQANFPQGAPLDTYSSTITLSVITN